MEHRLICREARPLGRSIWRWTDRINFHGSTLSAKIPPTPARLEKSTGWAGIDAHIIVISVQSWPSLRVRADRAAHSVRHRVKDVSRCSSSYRARMWGSSVTEPRECFRAIKALPGNHWCVYLLAKNQLLSKSFVESIKYAPGHHPMLID